MGRRGRSRLHVRLPARVVTRTRTLRGVLRDISLTGAGLQLNEALPIGEDVLIGWDRFEAFGRVVHMRQGLCGVHFDLCVLPTVLFATRDLDEAARLPDETTLVRQVARSWVEGVGRL